MSIVLSDPDDERLAEIEHILKQVADVPSDYPSQPERVADQECMAACLEYFRQRRRNRPIRLRYFQDKSPSWNLSALLEVARDLGLEQSVARNLAAAALQIQFYPTKVTERSPEKDFIVGTTCFDVTTSPTGAVITKCAENVGAGLHPVLVVPRDQVAKARHLAEDQSIPNDITIIAIEDYLASNIIELSNGQQSEFVATLQQIITAYNRRLEEVETDMSLKIEIK